MQKIVLITGCSSGFGYGMALKFSENGYKTFASVRNLKSEGAKKLQKLKRERKLPLEIIKTDVCSDESIKRAITYITRRVGRVDILVNNAGYGYLGIVEETPIDDVKALYDVNVFGVIRMIQAVVPLMRKKKSGLIINMSSISGIVPFPLFSVYSATKFAIETLTEGLRFELRHFGIHVVAIEPGSYLTKFSQNRKQPTQLMNPRSPYKQLINNFFQRYHQTHKIDGKQIVSKTANPQEVVDLIFRISQVEHPHARYRVGWDAHKNFFIRRLLPFSLWERVLHHIYKW